MIVNGRGRPVRGRGERELERLCLETLSQVGWIRAPGAGAGVACGLCTHETTSLGVVPFRLRGDSPIRAITPTTTKACRFAYNAERCKVLDMVNP